ESFSSKHRTTPRPSPAPIALKSRTVTFTHTHDFAIHNDVIWTRRRNDLPGAIQGEWSPIYFPLGKVPKEIYADGANLIVIDQEHIVHYKKVVREYRAKEVGKKPKIQAALKGKTLKPADTYIAIDKSSHNNWKSHWFSLPFVSKIVNLFTGKLLQLPQEYR